MGIVPELGFGVWALEFGHCTWENRRQLHVFNPDKNEYRRPDGGSMSQGSKRGGIVKHPKSGKCYVGGENVKTSRIG
ncbi:MAG: hypothetical protein WBA24_18650 [Geitlerinemataceae cyanobacterium]